MVERYPRRVAWALACPFLGPEEPPGEDDLVFSDDRGPVLDAIVDFGGELIVVVENKVAPSDDWQARYLNIVGARVKIGRGKRGSRCCGAMCSKRSWA